MTSTTDHARDRLPAPLAIALGLLAGWLLQIPYPLPAAQSSARWALGGGLVLADTWALLLTPLFVLGVHLGAVLPEVRYLERRFGDAYRDYRRRVSAWI